MLRKFIFLFTVVFALASCSAPQISELTPAPSTKAQESSTAVPSPTKSVSTATDLNNDPDLARADSQGSVEFLVVPKNLNAPAETLDFLVEMNTHSIDLSWNLAAQSTLTTDNGLSVVGANWPTGSGHHVQGTLKFPTKTTDGKPLLDGARKLTLTIKDAGASTRVFEWTLSK